MDDQGMAPTLRERASSTAITIGACVLVGLAATLVLGLVVWFLQVAFGIRVPLEASPGGGRGLFSGVVLRPADVAPASGTTSFGIALWLVVVVLVWLTACRGGVGTPGDAVMTLRPYDASGARTSRGRNLLRGAVPVAAFAVVVQLAGSGWALALLALLWAPALVRADRRTAVDLVLGVVPRSLAPAKTGRAWPAEAPDGAAPRS
jgi:hypothetical protein